MPQTGIINATNIAIYVGTVKIANAKSATVSLSMDQIDISTKDSAGWNVKSPGQRSWSMSGDGLVAFDTASASYYTANDINNALINRTLIVAKFTTNATGDYEYTGSGYFGSVETSAGVEDAVGMSYTIEGTGALGWALKAS